MGLASYLKLVEIRTKVASFLPFLGGTLYAAYRFGSLDWPNAFLMLGSLLCLDMATTTLNNYMDYKRARKKSGYGYEVHNAIVRDGLKEGRVIALLTALCVLSITFGLILLSRSSWPVFALGALSFLVAAAYSAGPLPLSRTPLGEGFSGFFMGLVIPLASVIIHSGHRVFFDLELSGNLANLSLNWREALSFLLFFMPMAAGIANIMLANNICDREDDRENGRATIPVLVGIRSSLVLWVALYAAGFLAVAAGALAGLLPWWMIFFVLIGLPVWPKIAQFLQQQDKATTFAASVQIFVLQALALCLLAGAGIIFSVQGL